MQAAVCCAMIKIKFKCEREEREREKKVDDKTTLQLYLVTNLYFVVDMIESKCARCARLSGSPMIYGVLVCARRKTCECAQQLLIFLSLSFALALCVDFIFSVCSLFSSSVYFSRLLR